MFPITLSELTVYFNKTFPRCTYTLVNDPFSIEPALGCCYLDF